MNNFANQFAAANKSAVENMLSLTNTVFASAERLATLNLNTARSVVEDSVATTKSLFEIKDAQALVGLTPQLAQPGMEKVTAYSRGVYEIFTQTKDEVSKIVEAQVSELNGAFGTALDKLAKSGPAGSDVAVSAVKSAMAAANSAYGNFSKAAKHVAEMTETNLANSVAAVSTATTKASSKSAANAANIKNKKAA